MTVTVQEQSVEGNEPGRLGEFLVLVEGVQVDHYRIHCYASASSVFLGTVLREVTDLLTVKALAFC